MPIIDAHLHAVPDHAESLALLDEFDLKLVNISVSRDATDEWRVHTDRFRELTDARPDRFAWCTAFRMPTFEETDYADQIIAQLQKDFEAGSATVKVWKNIGMRLQNPAGEYVMFDDPIFEPIYSWLERQGRSLMIHAADPRAAWEPLVPGQPHYNYFSKHPEWHFYGRPDVPSHEQILAARDRLVERHPRLRIIGAHLGSMEHDLNEVARRLRAWPHFSVDFSARLGNLMVHAARDHAAVREFFLEFPDRLIFGTDVVSRTPHTQLDADARADALGWMRTCYTASLAFLRTDGPVDYLNLRAQGLALPDDVLDKVLTTNAQRWMDNL